MGNMMITSGNRMRIWYIEDRLGRCCQFRWDGKIQHIRSSLFSGGSMDHNSIAEADFYIVSNTFQILEYNAVLSRKKPSVQKGDLCYIRISHVNTVLWFMLQSSLLMCFLILKDTAGWKRYLHRWMDIAQLLHADRFMDRQVHCSIGCSREKKICRLNKIYTGIL